MPLEQDNNNERTEDKISVSDIATQAAFTYWLWRQLLQGNSKLAASGLDDKRFEKEYGQAVVILKTAMEKAENHINITSDPKLYAAYLEKELREGKSPLTDKQRKEMSTAACAWYFDEVPTIAIPFSPSTSVSVGCANLAGFQAGRQK